MKVRIGNDIRLNLTLKGPRNYDEKNIKQLRCYLVNTSVTKCFGHDPNCCGCHKHDHVCGKPTYHVYPHCFWNSCEIPCCRHKKYPFTPCDPAFGPGPLPPKYEKDCCCDCHKHCCNHEYCRYGHLDPMSKCFDHHRCGFGCCGHNHCFWDDSLFDNIYFRPGYCDFVSPHCDEDFKYLAPSRMAEGKNKIQTYFPACDQYMCGDYKLVVVMVVYESGWGRCDLHTYTIDYGTAVTLVDDESGIDGDVTIDVDTDSLYDGNVSSMQTADEYTMLVNDKLFIGQKDFNGATYKVLVNLANGGSTEFDPKDWDFGSIKFYSDDPSIVSVDEKTGTLTAMPTSGDKETTIQVYSGAINTSFKVKVIGSGKDYIVFTNSTNVNDINACIKDPKSFPGSKVYEYDNIFGTHDLVNPTKGNYLCICSRRHIADSNTMHVRYSMFDVPLLPVKTRPADNLYYYICPNALEQTGTFDITVEP